MADPITASLAAGAATAGAAAAGVGLSPSDWIVPLVKTALEHPDELASGLQFFRRHLIQGSTVAFTGHAGVGKTVLYDHLRGDAQKIGYRPPDQSVKPERRRIILGGKPMTVNVVPGQASAIRSDALDKLFTGKNPVTGVVHVVSYGHVEVREKEAAEYAQQRPTDWFEAQRQAELEHFKEVGRYIGISYRQHKVPSWMIIAVAKYDLYYDQRDAAMRYYVDAESSEFGKEITSLVNQIGSSNFEVSVQPVSTYLDRYNAPNGTTISPQLTEPERDHVLTKFIRKMRAYCE